jgi:hypothetical protein
LWQQRSTKTVVPFLQTDWQSRPEISPRALGIIPTFLVLHQSHWLCYFILLFNYERVNVFVCLFDDGL